MGDHSIGLDQVYHGIEISSRYDLKHEIETIKAFVDGLPLTARLQLHSIWCDSKACACYSVEACTGADLDVLLMDIALTFEAIGMGYNGVFLDSSDGSRVLDPYWPGDDEGT